MPRSRLGPLAIETKLGDYPSQSSVWRAVHVRQQKAVAVKIFNIPFGGTPEARQDFADEWERLKRLQHPALARCYGGGFEENDAYLAYEFVDGETLAAMMTRRGRLPWETVLDLAEPLVDALNHIHKQQAYHGRIQPDKIMFAGLSPLLVDMRLNRDDGPFRTGREATAEETTYRPPEMLDSDEVLFPAKADIYSLGAVLYQAITGRTLFSADDLASTREAVRKHQPMSAASIVLDCPVWLDKLVMQMLDKDAAKRPNSAIAVKQALGEVRKRTMSRAGVAEYVSSGFSPLQVTDQKDRDEARVLLGQNVVDLDEQKPADESEWYEKSWFLMSVLASIIGVIAYIAWPLNEDQMRQRAESLLSQNTRGALIEAKMNYLEPMLDQFPDGDHPEWAKEQIDRVEMVEAEHVLSVKLKRNLPIKNEGERLYAEAQSYERFGDTAAALDQYRSIVTLMSGQESYRPFVNLARRQIAVLQEQGSEDQQAASIIQIKLKEADREYRVGNALAARQIWYSIVDLYADNSSVTSLVEMAQNRLSEAGKTRNVTP